MPMNSHYEYRIFTYHNTEQKSKPCQKHPLCQRGGDRNLSTTPGIITSGLSKGMLARQLAALF